MNRMKLQEKDTTKKKKRFKKTLDKREKM